MFVGRLLPHHLDQIKQTFFFQATSNMRINRWSEFINIIRLRFLIDGYFDICVQSFLNINHKYSTKFHIMRAPRAYVYVLFRAQTSININNKKGKNSTNSRTHTHTHTPNESRYLNGKHTILPEGKSERARVARTKSKQSAMKSHQRP